MADRVQEIHQKHPFVYHYTSRAGLEGILTTQTLFATHYRYLNDRSEIEHMRTALIRNLQHVMKLWIRDNITSDTAVSPSYSTQKG